MQYCETVYYLSDKIHYFGHFRSNRSENYKIKLINSIVIFCPLFINIFLCFIVTIQQLITTNIKKDKRDTFLRQEGLLCREVLFFQRDGKKYFYILHLPPELIRFVVS